ncbi:MAG TPA: AbrB/MazE/SpoVT family DNA-binding domain-containing protein [Candidatus Paceibacterota bacterium]|nr:AbrB/MazE/SpoVT family DNA-binding domain-containing protein [Candidatus Paceibacterota bacterium]
METKIKKWGNSLALRLPVEITSQLSLGEDSLVTLSLVNHALSIKPSPKKNGRLEELVTRINSSNTQPLLDWGEPVGREIW